MKSEHYTELRLTPVLLSKKNICFQTMLGVMQADLLKPS